MMAYCRADYTYSDRSQFGGRLLELAGKLNQRVDVALEKLGRVLVGKVTSLVEFVLSLADQDLKSAAVDKYNDL